MSRSNPTDNAPNPATRWFEWNGESGTVRYYDKAARRTVDVGTTFTFLVLDQLASIGGWHEPSESTITSNAVRDTRQDVLVVKAFKYGGIAEGFYRDIKATVVAAGGHFEANVYVGYRADDGDLSIGVLTLKGAALSAWMEFTKAHRADLYKAAIEIHGSTEGQKGRVIYRVPQFRLKPLSAASHEAAVELDRALQAWLTGYFARTKRDQVDTGAMPTSEAGHAEDRPASMAAPHAEDRPASMAAPHADDIPFAWLLALLVPAAALIGSGVLA